ncbi:MAG: laminin B domain-containing protein [Opitutaceae bacterium]|nr:laminin B domain-containing protein [Opitutaceae bacterium]
MFSRLPKSSFLSIFVVFLAFALPVGAQTSTFTSGSEGWLVAELNPVNFPITIASSRSVYWNASGGYISLEDTIGDWTMFQAPAAFLGNLSSVSRLEFGLRTSNGNGVAYPMIVLEGTDRSLYYNAGITNTEFQTFTASFTDFGSWRVNSYSSGAIAGASDFSTVLADVRGLFINGDWSGDVDTSSLTSVSLVSVPESSNLAFLAGVVVLVATILHRKSRFIRQS